MTREEIARLYRAGTPVKDIASLAGVCVGTLDSRLTRMRRDGWDLERRRERIWRLREERVWLLRMDFHLND